MPKDIHITLLNEIRKRSKGKGEFVKLRDITEGNSYKIYAINDLIKKGYLESRKRISDNEIVVRLKPEGVDFLNRNLSSEANNYCYGRYRCQATPSSDTIRRE